MPRCGDCAYSQEYYPAEDGEPGRNLCFYPAILLPISMQGASLREKETVDPERTDCRCWTVKDAS